MSNKIEDPWRPRETLKHTVLRGGGRQVDGGLRVAGAGLGASRRQERGIRKRKTKCHCILTVPPNFAVMNQEER